ncbi:cyclin-domain-containing protein [Aspergillus karnatakaensis]|uniref:putative cyclin-dependent protein kinase complex component n=1 Tax=Aspergillus karnatakaensis TaxID=1810916 RepID=UPI003CCD217E
MESVVLNHSQSNHSDSSYTMLGGTVPSSESVYRPSPHESAHPSSNIESGPSISTSNNNTPTFAAPPSASAAGSARFPSHDVPTYINRSSYTGSQSSSASSTVTPGPTPTPSYIQHQPASMNPTASGHPPRSNPSPQTAVYSSQAGYAGAPGVATAASRGRFTGSHSSPASPQLRPTYQSLRSLGGSEASSPSRIKIRDLTHIQSFASEEFLAQSGRSQAPGQWGQERQFEISSMPVTDIIEMVAGLLTKITTTNDTHHEEVHRHMPPVDGTSNLTQQAQSVLAFHGKNVPSISILSYLTRIHKYCPTTYEVFLSLLVYFDRMTDMVNKGQLERLNRHWSRTDALQSESQIRAGSQESSAAQRAHTSPMVTPPPSAGITAQDRSSPISPAINPQQEGDHLNHFFVVDSFNIHRLVIAGVTCASKFFSDVFYTNSRYAKVGGLPLAELNHLELQFLLLNDFRLSIPVEELEAYGTMLVEFYAREVIAQQQQRAQAQAGLSHPPTSREAETDGTYMRSRDARQPNHPEVRQTPTPP